MGGCTSVEHGAFLDDATLQLIADHGTYFDPNFLVLHNYLENKPKFLGIGNYNEEGFAYMEKGLPLMSEVLKGKPWRSREDISVRTRWRDRTGAMPKSSSIACATEGSRPWMRS